MSRFGSQPVLKLNNGLEMPLLGYGTFLSQPNEIGPAITAAIKVGYRHLDCARIYKNEKEIGDALQAIFKGPSGLKREDIWITSKLPPNSMKPEDVEPTCRAALADLQIDKLDLFLIHIPIPIDQSDGKVTPIKVPLYKTWAAMESLVDKGLVKSIGVSNFTVSHLYDLLSYARIKPVINQIERHPFLVQAPLVKFCKDNGIEITAYAPIGAPGFSEGKNFPSLLQNEQVLALAKKYNKTAAQILIRWSLDEGVNTIPKSVKEERIAENFGVLQFKLSQEDCESLTKLDRHFRYFTQTWVGVPFLN